MVLFYCNTPYHLFNAINVKLNLLENVDADLLVSDLIDLTAFIKPLSETGLFQNITIMKDRDFIRGFNQLDRFELIRIYRHPKKHMKHIKIETKYSDLYCFYVDPYLKTLYYYLVHLGIKPCVHLIEDGLSSYVVDFSGSGDNEVNRHYGKSALPSNISELLLYEPDFFSLEETYPIHNLPKIETNNQNLKSIYQNVFELLPLPKEQYVFFEEAFLDNFRLASDLIMMDDFANKVGKENIIIKLHPRNNPDRWLRHNFNVMESSRIPWEISVFMNSDELSSKTFLTASSTAVINSFIIFDIHVPSFFLYNIMSVGQSVHVRQDAFRLFIEKAIEKYNDTAARVFIPKTNDAFEEQLKYIERCPQ